MFWLVTVVCYLLRLHITIPSYFDITLIYDQNSPKFGRVINKGLINEFVKVFTNVLNKFVQATNSMYKKVQAKFVNIVCKFENIEFSSVIS